MKRTLLFVAMAAASVFAVQVASAATFSYHGVLQDAGKPAQGKYDIELTLYSSQSGGSVVGGPMTLYAVPVQDGSFSTDADFGPLSNSLSQAFVAVKVRPAGASSFTALAERSSVVETNASCPGSWSLEGNAGNPAGSYLGTADAKPLIFMVNGNQAASFTPGQGAALGPGDILGAFATGKNSFATGTQLGANGINSFAAGFFVSASNNNSFIWGDGDTYNGPGAVKTTSGPDQFVVRARGGVAINGTPKNNLTELSIYPPEGQLNYSNIFMGQTGSTSGMLMSAGDATATANSSSFYLDQFDGTHQARKMSLTSAGLIVNDPAGIPSSVDKSVVALAVVHSPTSTDATVDLFPTTTNDGYWQLIAYPAGSFQINSHTNVANFGRLALAANGDFYVTANAYKPGGGTWAATSDRRIKQEIEPIHDAVDTLMKLRPVNFHYTPEYRAMEGGLADKPYAGFIAQEYAQVFPSDVVSTDQHVPGAPKSDPAILALDSNPALITTVAAVQELSVRNSDLESQVARQAGLIAAQQKRLDALAAQMSKLQQKAN